MTETKSAEHKSNFAEEPTLQKRQSLSPAIAPTQSEEKWEAIKTAVIVAGICYCLTIVAISTKSRVLKLKGSCKDFRFETSLSRAASATI